MISNLFGLATAWLSDYDARASRRTFIAPPALTIDEAYHLQNEIARLRHERGESVVGYKVGCISRAIQEQLGVTEPVFGRLYATEMRQAGAQLSAMRYPSLAIEGELAIRLARDLPRAPGSDSEIIDAIGSVFPVIELHRYNLSQDLPLGPQLVVSSGMQAGLVLPHVESQYPPRTELDDRLCVVLNDKPIDSVSLDDTVQTVVNNVKWLSSKLAEFGLGLEKGNIVLTGSPMRLFPVGPKTRIVVTAAGLGQSRAEVCD